MSSFPSYFWEMSRGEHRNTYSVDSSDDSLSRFQFGQRMVYRDGRRFVFAGNDGTAELAAHLYQSVLALDNYDSLAIPSAVAVGATSLSVTNGATAVTANQFRNGYLNIEDDTGEGYAYKIIGNTADAGSGPFTVSIDTDDPVVVAMTTATTVSVTVDPYNNVIIHPSPPTAPLVGVACAAIAANKAGWYQRGGPASVRSSAVVPNEGKPVVASLTVDGAVDAYALTEAAPPTGFDAIIVGTQYSIFVTSTEQTLVELTMPI